MKKSLLALAVLGAFASAASAQSSVTVYGKVDVGVVHDSGAVANATPIPNPNGAKSLRVSSGVSGGSRPDSIGRALRCLGQGPARHQRQREDEEQNDSPSHDVTSRGRSPGRSISRGGARAPPEAPRPRGNSRNEISRRHH